MESDLRAQLSHNSDGEAHQQYPRVPRSTRGTGATTSGGSDSKRRAQKLDWSGSHHSCVCAYYSSINQTCAEMHGRRYRNRITDSDAHDKIGIKRLLDSFDLAAITALLILHIFWITFRVKPRRTAVQHENETEPSYKETHWNVYGERRLKESSPVGLRSSSSG